MRYSDPENTTDPENTKPDVAPAVTAERQPSKVLED